MKGKRQNQLTEEHISRIVETYQQRPKKEVPRYARRVSMKEIAENDCNLNISKYVSTAQDEAVIDPEAVHAQLVEIEGTIRKATAKHNDFLRELGLPVLPNGIGESISPVPNRNKT